MKKVYVSWHDVQRQVQELVRQMWLDKWTPDYVVGITRGGLTPANLISQYLDCPMETLKVRLRDGAADDCESNLWMAEDAFGYDGETVYYDGEPSRVLKPKKILVVDDINDTGATLNWIMNDWQEGCLHSDPRWAGVWNHSTRFAVVVDNLASECKVKMDYVGFEVNKAENDVWIDFPYEDWWTK